MGLRLAPLLRRAVPASVSLLTAVGAFAQVSPDIEGALRRSRQEQNQQLQRERNIEQADERARQMKAPSAFLDGGQAAREALSTTLPVETPCFTAGRVLLEIPRELPEGVRRHGASALPLDAFRFAQEYLNQYANQCVGREGINIIMRRLGAQILSRGYTTTRVAVPQQDLSSGTLRLTLIPGVIRQIRFADEALRGSPAHDPGRGSKALRAFAGSGCRSFRAGTWWHGARRAQAHPIDGGGDARCCRVPAHPIGSHHGAFFSIGTERVARLPAHVLLRWYLVRSLPACRQLADRPALEFRHELESREI